MVKSNQVTNEQVNNGLQVFHNSAFGELGVLMIDEKPHFPATECAAMLGYERGRDAISRHCRYAVKCSVPHPQSPSKQIERLFVPESDLYRLIIRSKLPAAQAFERWIFEDVVPTVRRYGMYATPVTVEAMLTDPDTMIKTLQVLKGEREQRQALEAKVAQDEPFVTFGKAVEECKNTVKIRDLALILNQNGVPMGQKRMFERLRDDGFLCSTKDDRWNMPTQRAMDLGLFWVHERFIKDTFGRPQLVRTPLVTGKGQVYLTNYYRRHREAQ